MRLPGLLPFLHATGIPAIGCPTLNVRLSGLSSIALEHLFTQAQVRYAVRASQYPDHTLSWVSGKGTTGLPGVQCSDPDLTAVLDLLKAAVAAELPTFGIEITKLSRDATDWIKANPKTTGLVIVGGVLVIYPGLVTGPALSALGFTSSGPLIGSVAAGWQSLIGAAVPAGSLFATLQSAAMGGYGLVVVNGGVQGIGAATILWQLHHAYDERLTEESLD